MGTEKLESFPYAHQVLIHRLHPFCYDESTADPKEIAARMQEEYEVQEILERQGVMSD